MTSAGSGIVHEVVEHFRPFGGFGVPDGVERLIVVRRHRAQEPANIVTSRWRYALMNWGHDPLG